MTTNSRKDAIRTIGQTNKVQIDKQAAQALVGIGLSIVYLADQVGELVTAIKEQPQINVEIKNPGGTDENHSRGESEGGNG